MDTPPVYYTIHEFSSMTGLPQSKIRYYDKLGLFSGRRLENGYRCYTPEDAFRSNAFRVLLLYGFSVEQAIQMLDEKQDTEHFRRSLEQRRAELERHRQLTARRIEAVDRALDFIRHRPAANDFIVRDQEDVLFVYASYGRDFTVAEQNRDAIARFINLQGISHFTRLIRADELTSGRPLLDPCYISSIPASEAWRLEDCPPEQIHRLPMGKCLVFHRVFTRAESVRVETFAPMLRWLEEHGYRMRGDFIIYPTFLNLDGNGQDVETVIVPIA